MTYRPVGHSLRVPRRTRTFQILKSSLNFKFLYGNNRAAKRRVAPPGPGASSIRRLSLLFWFNQNSLTNNSARLFTEIARRFSDDVRAHPGRHTWRALCQTTFCILGSRSSTSVPDIRTCQPRFWDQFPFHIRGLLLYLPYDFILSFNPIIALNDCFNESKIT